jgi:sulfur-carrier protein
MIRLILPAQLRTMMRVGTEVELRIEGPATLGSVFDALEEQYPTLRGLLRDHVSRRRRPLLRFFACREDLSHEAPDAPLPQAVVSGAEPLIVVAAIAGG